MKIYKLLRNQFYNIIGHYRFLRIRRYLYSYLINMGISHSKDKIDFKVLKRLSFKKEGFFIECGAADGITYSNSFLLEKKYAWKGILIEPINDQFNALKKYRKNAICEKHILTSIQESGKTIKIYDAGPESLIQEDQIQNLSMSNADRMETLEAKNMIKGIENVVSISLSELLDIHNINHVDVFFLDVEGSEINVLDGVDFNKHNIDNIVVETGAVEELKKYMKIKGFDRCENIARNDYIFFKS